MKLYTVAFLMVSIGLASCAGNDNKEYVDKSIMPTAEEKAVAEQKAATTNTAVLPANTAVPVNMPANLQPQQASPVAVSGGQAVMVNPQPQQNNVVMTQTQPAVQPTAPGMNPPHGQPGHRCDIAVGAPLNSKPAPATTTSTTAGAQPQQVTMTQVQNQVKTEPGMNPPHGEPNHRCDIAVGAPLNSKPATVTTTPAAAPPLLTAPKADSTKN